MRKQLVHLTEPGYWSHSWIGEAKEEHPLAKWGAFANLKAEPLNPEIRAVKVHLCPLVNDLSSEWMVPESAEDSADSYKRGQISS